MSRDQDELRKSLKKRPPPAEYDVGYRKPPRDSCFKPGQSGNPSGRPKGRKNRPKVGPANEEPLKEIILKEAYREITINDGGRQVRMPVMQVAVRSLAVNAARGNQRAGNVFTKLVALIEGDNKRRHDELLKAAVEYKIDWEIELERRKALDVEGPEPIPHPDHIVIDTVTGQVSVIGPLTSEEKAEWEWLRQRKNDCHHEIKRLERMLEKESDCRCRNYISKDIQRERRIREIISRIIPD